MLDKIANQKLFFISLIGIVVTSMILTTTFAYQSLGYTESAGANSNVAIEAGKLYVKYCRNDDCVTYEDEDDREKYNYNKIDVENLSFLPDYKTASYVEFVVDNTSSTDDVAYMITLSPLTYNKMFVSEAFKYTVVVVNDDGTLTEVNTGNFSTLTGDSFDLNLEDRTYKYIDKGTSEKVRIYLWLDENVDVQLDLSDTSERQFKGYVNVSSIFEGEIVNPLLYRRLINSAKLASKNEDSTRTVYNDTFDLNNITGSSSKNDKMLALAADDYGTSYVYRGAIKDNYVNFAGFTWRVVRINGDGSIRLILDGTLDKICIEYESDGTTCKTYAGSKTEYNILENDNAYVGYMYGFTGGETNKCLTKDETTNKYIVDSSDTYITEETCEGSSGRWVSTPYEATHINKNSSTIKNYVDIFYETYLLSNYNDYMADTIFCNDKTLANVSIGENNTGLGYSKEITFYSSSERLYYSNVMTSRYPLLSSLKCAENVDNNFSRFTVKEQVLNNISTNGDLTYPIGLLSADEFVMAGAMRAANNETYYLYDAFDEGLSNDRWWLMTPHMLSGDENSEKSYIEYATMDKHAIYYNYATVSMGIRPVINLKSNLLWASGDGTKNSPYEVMLSE